MARASPAAWGNGRCSQQRLRVAKAVGRAQVSSLWLVAGWWRKEGESLRARGGGDMAELGIRELGTLVSAAQRVLFAFL